MINQKEVSYNLNRLVRSASNDEAYCSLILDKIKLGEWTGQELDELWSDAETSNLTVQQFIDKYKEKFNGHG